MVKLWNPVEENVRRRLFDVIIGKTGNFSRIWLLQAWLVKNLLFEKIRLRPTSNQIERLAELRKQALIRALTDILWRVTPGQKGPVRLIVPFPPEGDVEENQFYASWMFAQFESPLELRAAIEKHFDRVCRYGMVPFLSSMVFSRGPDRVHLEAAKDLLVDPTDEDCFQPLVNLIVTGRAVSNVFDSPRPCTEDDHPKRGRYGIIKRSPLGFMTSVELTNNFFAVGRNLKFPKYPIWVIHGDFHYSVLFCDEPRVIKEDPKGDTFYWYTVTAHRGVLLNRQYTVKLDIKQSLSKRSTKLDRNVTVLRDCMQIRWPKAKMNVEAMATERKIRRRDDFSENTTSSSSSFLF
ncbi:probable ubiquitin carboxyl-terminal hydrolase MINDY-4 isoform X2 [Varroa jacobsoni]|uniref:Ubiquitin carboxyl-terminal hydrolase MINDY n=1 Tax=Varroa destructor TaxID=109461 RepID=A0A7M7JBZ1_VARDE|nr:probable ubiquitin carboxyl-terminal hydrolase MINDY-4 isoform X2 [Varroa destructor]XP_022686911.1 probable ubiquitin carboxyl-terminal hydrolase MINDY-4 isoform X2 [Varroa jacobsoni]